MSKQHINAKAIAKSFFLTKKERKERHSHYTKMCFFGNCYKDELHDCVAAETEELRKLLDANDNCFFNLNK